MLQYLTRRLPFFIILFLLSPNCYADSNNSLDGIIRDQGGQPITGAIISIPDLHRGTVTDTAGNYLVEDLPAGKYVVEIKASGYASQAISIAINGAIQQNFVLKSSAIEIRDVVVTGQSKATEIRRSPIPVVAISKQYLQQNLSTNIIDAISHVPGITALTTGPNVSKPYIRGLGYNRVLTLYNNMRQEGQQWGDEHGVEVDEYSVDHVEVIKGPASLIYGSDALAGVVNMIPTPPAVNGQVTGNIIGEYQGNNNMAGGSAMLSGNRNGFFWLGRISHKMAKDYRNAIDGRVYGTNFNETDGNASLGLIKNWGHAYIDIRVFDDRQGIPDGSRDSATRLFTRQITEADSLRPIVTDAELNSYELPVLHQHVQHYSLFSNNSFNLGRGRIALNAGFERSVRREYSHPQAATTAGLYLRLNTWIYDLKYYFLHMNGWELTAGINGMYQTNDVTSGTDFLVPSYHLFDAGPFAMVKKTFSKLDLSGGLRFDSRSFHNEALYSETDSLTGFTKATTDTSGTLEFAQYDHSFSGLSGSFGLAYNFSPHFSMKANIARGFRAPNIAEISANGVHSGTESYQLGNPAFKPEYSQQEDIGFDYISGHLSVSFSVFYNQLSNYIFNQSLDSEIVAGLPTFQYQQGKAALYGGELSVDLHPHPLDWLHFENGFSVVYGENRTDGQMGNDSSKYLPSIPPAHGFSELRADFRHPAKRLGNTFFKVEVEYYARQSRAYLAYGTETETPGYTLLNASAGTEVLDRKGNVLFDLSVFGANLADLAYHNHLNRLKYFEDFPNDARGHEGIYNTGRNIGIRITVPLCFL